MRKAVTMLGLLTVLAGCDAGVDPGPDGAPTRDGGALPPGADAGPLPPGVDGGPPAPGATRLPLEVLGEDGYTVSATLNVDDPTGVDALWLRTHRLAYRGASGDPTRVSKGSVRLNDGEWVRLSPDLVTCEAHEQAYSCLEGPYHVLRLTVPLEALGDALRAGDNRLDFRFEGTEGFSMGYRVLALDFLRDGEPISPPSAFYEDDPNTWGAPRPADVAEGERLWREATLVESPLHDSTLRAACADCHAHDGRDLAYFNFSNWSIVARSMFHGLTEEQGEQIASYVRNVDLGLPEGVTHRDLGRPWNPPYQPGPGLDARPVIQWSAGAGASAAFVEDLDTWDALFPEGDDAAAMAARLGPDGDVNHRELPVAILFPDWNDWLPEIHPLDLFGEEFEEDGYEVGTAPPYEAYQRVRASLDEGDVEEALDRLSFFAQRIHGHGAAQIIDVDSFEETVGERRVMYLEGDELVVHTRGGETIRTSREDANRGLRHWSSVKQWEIMLEYGLEERAGAIRGGAPRSWGTQARNVFELAPHRAAPGNDTFAHQSLLVGKYLSTVWYQLQVSLNSGRGFTQARLAPVDWNYQPNHVSDLATKVPGPAHPVRYAATVAEMLQTFANRSPQDSTWGLRQMHPVRWAPSTGAGDLFDRLDPDRRARLLGAMLAATMDLFERHPPSTWRRDADTSDGVVEPESYVPETITDSGLDAAHQRGRYADCWYTMIPRFREAGVDEAILTRVIDFGAAMWPAGDWDALR